MPFPTEEKENPSISDDFTDGGILFDVCIYKLIISYDCTIITCNCSIISYDFLIISYD